MWKQLGLSACALTFVLMCAGCQETPRDGFDDLLKAAQDKDADALWSRFDRESREMMEHYASIGASGGMSAKEHLVSSGFSIGAVDHVREISRNENTAELLVVDLDGNKQTFTMRWEDEKWRLHLSKEQAPAGDTP